MKAATDAVFSLDVKYAGFPELLLVYVWYVTDPARTQCFCLTYNEALAVAERAGWTTSESWAKGKYANTRPSERLRKLLEPFEMDTEKWWVKICGSNRGAS
jgi:hypothetical protein